MNDAPEKTAEAGAVWRDRVCGSCGGVGWEWDCGIGRVTCAACHGTGNDGVWGVVQERPPKRFQGTGGMPTAECGE